MNKSWIEERADLYSAAVALEDAEVGRRIFYRDLPALLQKRGNARAKPGLLITRRATGLEHAIDLMAAAFHGLAILPTSPRLPEKGAGEILVAWGMEDEVAQLLRSGITFSCASPGEGTLLASSGSTGIPKLLFHPWSAHVANAEGAAKRIPLHPGHRWQINLPLWHTSGFAALFRALHAGATAVFGNPAKKITHRSIVATQLLRELNEGSLHADCFEALLAGGGPAPSSLRQRALDAGLPLHVTYGLTEAASQVCTTERLRAAAPETCGNVLPGCDMVIDAHGEILLRGPALACGRWNHSLKILEPLPCRPGGWWATGDLARQNDGGEILIAGRKDRMFVCAGENLHPERIEQALVGLPGILQAVVLAFPDSEYGAVPIAFVDGTGKPALWREMLADSLSGLEIPKRWFAWPDAAGEGAWTIKPPPKEFEKLVAMGLANRLE